MIISAHLLTGAAIASRVQIVPLALFFAFLSHYFLDFLPHQEYSIEKIKKGKWQKSFFDFLKIGADASFGLLIIFLLALDKEPIIYLAAFFAILPDFLIFLNVVFNEKCKLLRKADRLHKKIHFSEKNKKKLSFFRGAIFQLMIFVAAVWLLIL